MTFAQRAMATAMIYPERRAIEMNAPDKFERLKPLTKEQKEARKENREAEARMATAENAKAAAEFAKNRERLKAERLAREAGEIASKKED
ncbi:multidrug efflux pump subunit AcrA (membrane-fusion protein) [Nitrobacter vulgaris]|jgi:hypothetical protein|uniref:hypothetical protein n=1 Tax=Nitrobacter vulgaris TaxID=29421 RepID=UPI002865B598|nr:hypothetical protein [Nitrobacter vulgaris]MDR6306489.1 multidrug efflux pump subunit AcrA (membrane-fusion protein) [Nitrobacter vulgaris]